MVLQEAKQLLAKALENNQTLITTLTGAFDLNNAAELQVDIKAQLSA